MSNKRANRKHGCGQSRFNKHWINQQKRRRANLMMLNIKRRRAGLPQLKYKDLVAANG